ncbi:MAG: hypothetical protein AB7S44_01710 [Spirochaetales bacterium]
MKSSYSINFYKAYMSWKRTLEDDKKYKDYKESLHNNTSGNNFLSGVVGNKLLDFEWLEKIEATLPFMDKAIRESRTFIEQKDEIVPIEKVKRVNTQSIRHLAQHTNMIARVEKNNEVKPDRILNIYYESNSAIYENRFLFTLLGRLNEFIERRYEDLRNKDERIDVKYDINKTVKRKNKVSTMTLEFAYKTQADNQKVDVTEDVSHLSGYGRIVRIRRIISDFYSLPLIKELHGVELIKPPLIQTNLLTKNVNFKTCVDLWDYISRYNSKGYTYEDKTFDGKMPKRTDDELSDVFVFTNFLTEIVFNTEFKRHIERDYKQQLKLEKEIEKRNKELEIQRRKDELEEKIRVAIERKTTPLNKKIEVLEDKYKLLQFKHEALQYKHKIMVDMANDVMRQHRLIEKEQQNIRDLRSTINSIEEQIRTKNVAIAEARHTLNMADYPITQEKAEQRIKEQRDKELREKVLKYQEIKQKELNDAIKKYQEEKLKEYKEQVLKFQETKQDELKVLPIKVDGLSDDEIEALRLSEETENTEQIDVVEPIVEEPIAPSPIDDLPIIGDEEGSLMGYGLPEEDDSSSDDFDEDYDKYKLEELIQKLKELEE